MRTSRQIVTTGHLYRAWGETVAGAINRPSESRALVVLGQLARDGGGYIERGALALAGARRTAWIALTGDGRLLAAVLIDGDEGNGNEDGE